MQSTQPWRIDTETGLLDRARYVASPNCDARPGAVAPDLIVVHGISLPPGAYGGPWIDRLFTNSLPADAHPYFATISTLQVSSHLLVRRDGGVVQYVPFHLRAWHAGASNYCGRERCNDFSVAIFALCATYPSLSPRHVTGHSDIAPGRKTDPGPAFDWPRLRALLRVPRR
jgi:N-acetyl-anhydromuramoyl-L-alanine amidase